MAAPPPAGGTIEDGTYVATDYVIYGRGAAVAPTPFIRAKVVIRGGEWQTVTGAASNDAASVKTQTAHASTQGTTLSLAEVCPRAGAAQTYPYTFAATDAGTKQLRYFNGTAEVGALTLEKQ